MADGQIKFGKYVSGWRCVAIVALLVIISLIIALIVVIVVYEQKLDDSEQELNEAKQKLEDAKKGKQEGKETIPCPTPKGGLLTSGDPQNPSPFHDLTLAEYDRVYRFLKQESKVNLKPPVIGRVDVSSIFMMDLLASPKKHVLRYLDSKGPQPAREARVMVFRGDKTPPVVEEYRVGPLSQPTYAELITSSKRRNPVPFSYRPMGNLEFIAMYIHVMPKVDQKVGHIVTESYGGKFTECGDRCLTVYTAPMGTQLLGQDVRKIWLLACYNVEYYTVHALDFGLLMNLEGSDPTLWAVDQVWYSGAYYSSLDDLANKYANDLTINKTRIEFVHNSPNLTSSQNLRGDPMPETPQRPPFQMDPDGKRYSIRHRHVDYLHWHFDIRLSAFTGPQVYDIRFKEDRIAYELGLSEMAVFYSGFNPMQRVTDFVDSGALIGTHSKSLIPGVDCPEDATYLNVSFFGEGMEQATELDRAQCVFEQNTGVPLRRHLSYAQGQGGFFGGMSDSVLIVRSILTIVNYDYIVDYIFHQNGAIECRAISTGYIMSTFYHPNEAPYGFKLNDDVTGNIHHHMFHFRADLDIGGTSNRYETLDISEEEVQLQQTPPTTYRQIKFDRHLYNKETEAVYQYDFDAPKYHIVHNEQKKTKHGVPRAYRVHVASMSKQLLTKGRDNEKSIPWARQQLAVTVHKDDELVGSSPYAMFDSLHPVADFSQYINDNETIVDEDLVLWITMGVHHIPHTEDIPVTPTAGGHLSFFLLPYNYFPECPSVASRDNIRVDYINRDKPSDGLKVERNGNSANQVCGVITLEQLVKDEPDHILQTHRDFRLV